MISSTQEAWVAELGKVTGRRKIDRDVSILTVKVSRNSGYAPAGYYVVESFHESHWRVLTGPHAFKREAARSAAHEAARQRRRSG